MDWSFQLYSARNFQPWDKVIQTLAKAGYKQVEGFGGLYGAADSLKAELDKNGLTMPSGHFSLDMLESDSANALRIAKLFGMKVVACPHIAAEQRPVDAAGWQDFGKRLAKVGKAYQDAGFRFGWHNHDFEFKKLPDGSTPMAHILDAAPSLDFEMDVAWVIRGGADPLKWIDDYASRIVAVHVKDIAPAGEAKDEDGWADVGHGTVDWAGLIKAFRAKTKAKIFVMEHDNPSDYERFARRSIESAKTY
jgi:sugar phosphate isomerase/epimerase